MKQVYVSAAINAMPDRHMLVAAARKNVAKDINPGIFKWNDILYFHVIDAEDDLHIGFYDGRRSEEEPLQP